MMLEDIRDYIDSLSIADLVYQAKMPGAVTKAIGVYDSRHAHAFQTAIGGEQLKSYGTRWVTFLVHWTKSPRETEAAAMALLEALRDTREAAVNGQTIKFIQLLVNQPVDVGTDDDGVYERVIEAAIIYQKER